MTRVLIAGGGTGGHLMPALALAEAIQRERPEVEAVLVGAARGVEAGLLPNCPYRYHLLPLEPIYRRRWWRNLRWPLILWQVMRLGARVLDAERPVLAVGTGGYAAGPILLQAANRGIPIALQEQNAFPGITTRWLARRARQIHLGFPEAREYLRPGQATEVYTYGNPIVAPPDPRPTRDAARGHLGIPESLRAVLVMGGRQGAQSINDAVAHAIDAGAFDNVTLMWSTGPGMWERYRGYDAPPARQLRPFWDPIADAYAAADLVVSRAGAMTTAELCAWGLPSILIPLPLATAGHQARNAEALAQAGAAVHIPDSQASGEALAAQVHNLLRTPERLQAMGHAAGVRGRPEAASHVARQLLALVS